MPINRETLTELKVMLRAIHNSNVINFNAEGTQDALYHLYGKLWLDCETGALVLRQTPTGPPRPCVTQSVIKQEAK